MSINVAMKMEKMTKNCVKFAEITENEFAPEKLGSVYVQKAALAELGYHGGNINIKLVAEIGAEDTDMLEGIGFKEEKATKNTVKFAEVVGNEYAPESIGSLYIPKVTLAELKWAPGLAVMVKIELPE